MISSERDSLAFLKRGGQKANPIALKKAVEHLCSLATAKNFNGDKNAELDLLELYKWIIICEACALVQSGAIDKLIEEGKG